MRIILVTGGNRGIGLEICRQLDKPGHTVIMGSRNFEKGRQAARPFSHVVVKQLDVTDEKSIRELALFFENEYGKLDVLVNNAGIWDSQSGNEDSLLLKTKKFLEANLLVARQLSKKIVPVLRKTGILPKRQGAGNVALANVKEVMETNFYGPWRMIQAFLPLLQKSEEGRIINMSSGLGELNSLTGQYPGYSLSKTSLNALTIMFSNELKEDGIKVNAMCPGWVKTDMGGPDAPRSVSQGADTAVWLAMEADIPTGKFFRDRKEINW
jgi:NAD(P)-dependent dehydrogenase (short-subunit alcohol dehydrogenase family)